MRKGVSLGKEGPSGTSYKFITLAAGQVWNLRGEAQGNI
jgi:hypothetical protein